MENAQTLNQFIQCLIKLRDEHGAGDMPIRVRNVYATGTSDGAEVYVSTEQEYTRDDGSPYVVIG